MPRKPMPTSLRAAIWRAHDKRCVYCTELVKFSDLDVDHIIPHSLLEQKEKLERLKEEYGLPRAFEVDSLTNLIPSHRHCNLQKLGKVLPKNRALHFLSIAEAKALKAERIKAGIKRQMEQDNVTVLVQTALDAGLLSPGQMTVLLASYSKGRNIFEIVESLPFRDERLKGFFSSSDIDLLYERPILPRPHGLEQLEMIRDAGEKTEKISVVSCREWAEAVEDGFFTCSTYDMKEEAFFRRVYAIVTCLAQARVPNVSYLSDGIANVDILPITILPSLSEEGSEELLKLKNQGVTMKDLIETGRVRIIERSPLSLRLEFDYMGLVLNEIMRADMDGDGVEDLLIGEYEYATEGTYGAGSALLLTRSGPDKPFMFLSSVQLTPEKEQR